MNSISITFSAYICFCTCVWSAELKTPRQKELFSPTENTAPQVPETPHLWLCYITLSHFTDCIRLVWEELCPTEVTLGPVHAVHREIGGFSWKRKRIKDKTEYLDLKVFSSCCYMLRCFVSNAHWIKGWVGSWKDISVGPFAAKEKKGHI